MAVTFDPETRLNHMEGYLGRFHLNLSFEEGRIQLLRMRLTGYRLVAEIGDGEGKKRVDDMIKKGYESLGEHWERETCDPYDDPCHAQYEILAELRSYVYRDLSEPFMTFIRSEFRKIFVPTLRLLTELCRSANKYTWEQVKVQLQEIMTEIEVDVEWEVCDEYMEGYLAKVSEILDIGDGGAAGGDGRV
ncbi:MAG: hypothetical protein METHAR1v1_1430004 [Methanothrix sp.]|nr:MAG: hypothetical protein METHAR1v1_1430004 [Methanothrix sp.]